MAKKRVALILLIVFSTMLLFGVTYARNGGGNPDSDGLGNAIETNVYGTDAEDWNSDDDSLGDGFEVAIGSNPLEGSGSDSEDVDMDNLGDLYELNYGTSTSNWDTDNDGYSDGYEIAAGTNPLVSDGDNGGDNPDHDGLSTPLEIALGTNPNYWDSDYDGYGDDVELIAGTDPTDPLDYLQIGAGLGGEGAVVFAPKRTPSQNAIIAIVFIIGVILIALFGVCWSSKKKK